MSAGYRACMTSNSIILTVSRKRFLGDGNRQTRTQDRTLPGDWISCSISGLHRLDNAGTI